MSRQLPRAQRRALVITAAALVCLAMCLLIGCKPSATTIPGPLHAPPPAPEERVAKLRADIAALDFLNRLQLEHEQTAKLVPLLETARDARARSEAREQELLGDLAQLLERQVEHLRKDEPLPSDLEAQIVGVETELRNLPPIDPQVEKAVGDGLRETLSPDQIAVVMGALETHIQAGDMLDGFRELRPDEFDAQIGPFARELARPGAGMTPEQLEALFREARTLSADEYRAGKSALLEALQPLFAPGQDAADQLLVRAFVRPHVLELLTDTQRSGGR